MNEHTETATLTDTFTAVPPKRKRDFSLYYKIIAIACIALGFLVGMQMIDSLVNERERYQSQVINDIKRMHTKEQQLVTPIIVVPQTVKFPCKENSSKNATSNLNILTKSCRVDRIRHIVPTASVWQHQVAVSDDNYKRNIYRAISFNDKMSIKTSFSISDKKLNDHASNIGTNTENSVQTHWQQAKIIFPVSDLRGLQDATLTIAGKRHRFVFPEKEEYLGLSYVEAALPNLYFGKTFDLAIHATLNGISALSAVPLGKSFNMKMNADWPHPQFFGNALPAKEITKNGFNANWNNSYHSVANTQKLNQCAKNLHESCHLFSGEKMAGKYMETYASNHETFGFGVQFVNAADTYTFTDRTIKYALLLLLVVFGAFFLFEVTKDLRIHPIQYSLVGAALLVFYVLLLSLSEQLDFSTAYLAAATACVGLMGWYVFYVLESVGRAALFTSILASLYASFYFIIQSEDNSLVMGSVFMFVLLAAVMFFTRHIDWYEKG